MNITDKSIQAYIRQAQKDTSKKYQYHSIGNNLWLRVHTKSGNAAWLYRIALPDKNTKSGYKFSNQTIGQYPICSLLDAKLKAAELLNQVKSGINPVAAKESIKKSKVTVSEIWQAMLSASKLKPRTLDNYHGMFNNHIHKLGNLPITSINNELVFNEVIKPILDNGNYRHANMVLCKFKQAINFAYNTFMIEQMPIDSRLTIPSEYKARAVRENTILTDDLPIFINALEKSYRDFILKTTFHHLILLILILGTRKTELATAKWEQYNKTKQTLLLTDTKTGDDLLIKLPKKAIELLEELHSQRINEYIFYSDKNTNSHLEPRSVLKNLNRIIDLYAPDLKGLTVHDLRRTFSSRLAGLGFRFELIEKATNHRIQGTAKHYQHDDMLEERYEMLETWANYLESLIK